MLRVESSARSLRDFLAGRDIHCPKCEYLLRDCTSDTCPECGGAIDRVFIQSLIDAEKRELRGFGQLLLVAGAPPMLLASAIAALVVMDLPNFSAGGVFVIALLLGLSFYPLRLGWRMTRRLPADALPPTWARRATASAIYLLVGLVIVDIVIVGIMLIAVMAMLTGA